jgi:hypothetical protein
MLFPFSITVLQQNQKSGGYNKIMTRKLRIFFGLVILAVSITLLIWSLWPVEYETRTQPVEPVQMQLPTPSSFFPGPWLAS